MKSGEPLQPDEGRGEVEISILCSDFHINKHTNGLRQRGLRCHTAFFWGAKKNVVPFLDRKCVAAMALYGRYSSYTTGCVATAASSVV